MATVYVTRGRKYHTDAGCPLMNSGEDLWDSDSEDWSHTSGSYRRKVDSVQYAAACGKLPGLFCTDQHARVFPPLYGQTFGHEPTRGISLFGQAETVCQRCTERGAWFTRGNDDFSPVHILWPCTSAVVLGLEARPEPR